MTVTMRVVVTALWLALIPLSSASYVASPDGGAGLSDAFLREMVVRMGSGLAHPPDYLHLAPHGLELHQGDGLAPRAMKELPDQQPMSLDYDALALNPSIRDQEYLAHSSLLSSLLANYEGKMRTQPHQSSSSTSKISSSTTTSSTTDGVLPAYCNPPNPCPLGYTAADGCLEEFENTAAFSRDYQAEQECMCDTEHMFECSDSTQDDQLTALARSIQNEGMLDSALDKIMRNLGDERERMVAKKFHQKKSDNPYLQGEKLPVAAKKGGRL